MSPRSPRSARRDRGAALAPRDSAQSWPPCSLCSRTPTAWTLDVPSGSADEEGALEALLTLTNGYLATRGAAPESCADDVHYPGTYVAGVYNRLLSRVEGVLREDESIVNLPNWLPLGVRAFGANILDGTATHVAHDHRTLDLRRGILHRELRTEDAEGRRTVIGQERFVSLRHPHLAYLRTVVTPLNWSGELEVASWIDGTVRNGNVASFRDLAGQHLEVEEAHADPICLLVARTVQSRHRIAVATRTLLDGSSADHVITSDAVAGKAWNTTVEAGVPFRIDKAAAVFTSRDHAISEPSQAARTELRHASAFPDARREHAAEWEHVWRRMRLEVDTQHGPDALAVQRALNLHIFHVAQTLSRHAADADVGVPARGLHGEAYRGRIFWDELFVFPLLNLRTPEVTRAMLLYRYRRLTEARRLAESIGYDGALFPWQSGSDGREETPTSFYNPRSDSWIPDHSMLQFHVGLAVAFNTWQYFQVTGDINFLSSYGAEILVEIARFWASRAEYDARTERYHLRGMMGPDEFHDGRPDDPGGGIDDNAYVAVMTSWALSTALRAHAALGGDDAEDLWQRLGVDETELEQWDRLSRSLYVPFLTNGLIAQFEGYEDLDELDLDAYRARYSGDIGRLDLILNAEGDSTNRYKVSKQADVLMLFYLFSADELAGIFDRMGYRFDPATIPATISYYLARTTHGSTLSRVAHAWVLARSDRLACWDLLRQALDTDLADAHSSTTREGIHLGAMAATADLLQRCFTGLEIRDDTIYLHPQLPDALTRLTCDLRYRGHWLRILVTHRSMRVTSRLGTAPPITVVVDGRPRRLACGDTFTARRAHSRRRTGKRSAGTDPQK